MLRTVMRSALWAGGLCAALTAGAKNKTAIEIEPGPTSMSAEEKAIVAQPEAGIERGVILAEEYERNENLGTDDKYGYHMRAKVLSAEGRAMGDIEIRHDMNRGDLYEWWGRTILPDGTVQELKREDLHEQIVADLGPYRVRYLKGALPGLVPGCVIDFGYVYKGGGRAIRQERVFLQRSWPIRKFRYRWVPFEHMRSSYRMTNTDGLQVTVVNDSGSVLVTGTDIPAFVEEAYMPPRKEVQPAVRFYYLASSEDPEHFWSDEGRRLETEATEFFGQDKEKIDTAIASMSFPADADLEAKLRTVYDWILDNIKNLSLRSREDRDADAVAGKKAQKERRNITWAKDVLERREGWGMQISHLFMGFARALGAEAHVLEAPDRTDHYFDPKLYDTDQFNGRFIVVGTPGRPYEQATIVDPGDGLPWGELPWQYTATRGLLGTAKGAEIIAVPAGTSTRNLTDDKVAITFDEEDQAAFRWTHRITGARAHSDRSVLMQMSGQERTKRLETMCGSRSDVEVSRAEVLKLEELRQPLEVACEGVRTITGPNEAADAYRFSVDGPWNGEIPELTGARRLYPIIFKYPRTDMTAIDVEAPKGFAPEDPPPYVKLDINVGSYLLSITKTETGYHVERSFTFVPVGVAPQSYETLRQFLNDAREADRTKLVFKRVTPS